MSMVDLVILGIYVGIGIVLGSAGTLAVLWLMSNLKVELVL